MTVEPTSTDPLARLEKAYAEKQPDYFEFERPEMLKLFPSDAQKVLDVGCGGGVFGLALKKYFGCEVWGVEPDEKSVEKAGPRLHHVFQGYFDDKLALPANYFDCIIFNDVLEHMIDPAFTLDLARKLLAPGGRIMASIPNVAHFPNVWRLMFHGRWDYAERGILDRTHLRFFTRHSVRQLFESNGFSVQQLQGINAFAPMQPGDERLWKFYRLFSLLPNPHIRDMRFLQFGIVAGLKK